MASILVTGQGSVGVAVSRRFALEGFSIVSYDVASPRPQVLSALNDVEDEVKFVRGDVRDQFRLVDIAKENDVEGIIHTAALTTRGSGITYPTAQFSVNALGLLNVLETARILDVGRVIFTSSVSLYEGITKDREEPIKETEPIDPSKFTWIYSVAKYSGEIMMQAYRNIYGMDTVTCRLHNIYGIAEINPKAIGSFLRRVIKGEEVVEPLGADNVGDYSYSGDLAEGIYILFSTDGITDPRIYHLSDGRPRRLGDIVEIINTLGPGKVKLGPGKGGKYGVGSFVPLDISRAKELGYAPKPIEESLKEYAAWIKKTCQ